jgi:hypothetical protein
MTLAMSAVMIVLGVVLVVRTIAEGGGPLAIGMLLGVLFVAAGLGRIWVSRRTP